MTTPTSMSRPAQRSTREKPPACIVLRDARESDLPALFEFQLDPVANRMAAFTAKDPTDRAAYMTKWTRLLADSTIVLKVILIDDQIVGSIGSWVRPADEGHPEPQRQVTYWIAREHWGRGIATAALELFLRDPRMQTRPLYASAAKDNGASIRVLEKCGFIVTGCERAFANGRGEEIDEAMLVLS
jgi:RimJ/RimL family protein N-acetyltransferase